MTAIDQQEIVATIRDAKRVTMLAPKPLWRTAEYENALAILQAQHPDASIFHPADFLTREPEWNGENFDPEAYERNRKGQIAWGHILTTTNVAYILPDGRGNIGSATVGNITRLCQHGAIICYIAGTQRQTGAPLIEVLSGFHWRIIKLARGAGWRPWQRPREIILTDKKIPYGWIVVFDSEQHEKKSA